MPSYEISVEAATDIEAIGDYGVSTFGLAQALKYQLALESPIRVARTIPPDGLANLRSPARALSIPLQVAHDLLHYIRGQHRHCTGAAGRADFKRHFAS